MWDDNFELMKEITKIAIIYLQMFWDDNAQERCILSFKYAIGSFTYIGKKGRPRLSSFASFQTWSPARGFGVSINGQ